MVESTNSLAQLKTDLLAKAKKHLDAYDSYDVKFNGTKVECEVRQTNDPDMGGCIVTISKAKVPGLTIEKFKEFAAAILENTALLDSKLKITKLDDLEGQMRTVTTIKMPMMMTNRSIFNIYHPTDCEDGSFIGLASSIGTEEFVASAEGKKLLGKNVLATNHINYRHIVPYDGGCHWTSVVCTDIGGSIPGALKNQAAGKMAKQAEGIINFIMTGEKPKD